eukprot:2450542-Rhodomonas_salina.3
MSGKEILWYLCTLGQYRLVAAYATSEPDRAHTPKSNPSNHTVSTIGNRNAVVSMCFAVR